MFDEVLISHNATIKKMWICLAVRKEVWARTVPESRKRIMGPPSTLSTPAPMDKHRCMGA